ncbi:hypothetical protein PV325_007136 [Microctonus aethiopoides]|nr:hypothetical protein PV325_007136 [Microctonus aethiopoides]
MVQRRRIKDIVEYITSNTTSAGIQLTRAGRISQRRQHPRHDNDDNEKEVIVKERKRDKVETTGNERDQTSEDGERSLLIEEEKDVKDHVNVVRDVTSKWVKREFAGLFHVDGRKEEGPLPIPRGSLGEIKSRIVRQRREKRIVPGYQGDKCWPTA